MWHVYTNKRPMIVGSKFRLWFSCKTAIETPIEKVKGELIKNFGLARRTIAFSFYNIGD